MCVNVTEVYSFKAEEKVSHILTIMYRRAAAGRYNDYRMSVLTSLFSRNTVLECLSTQSVKTACDLISAVQLYHNVQ